jgi:hypothetical protein
VSLTGSSVLRQAAASAAWLLQYVPRFQKRLSLLTEYTRTGGMSSARATADHGHASTAGSCCGVSGPSHLRAVQ